MNAKQVRALIARLGTTQVGLAEAMGVDASTVRRWVLAPDARCAVQPTGAAAKVLRLLEAGKLRLEDLQAA